MTFTFENADNIRNLFGQTDMYQSMKSTNFFSTGQHLFSYFLSFVNKKKNIYCFHIHFRNSILIYYYQESSQYLLYIHYIILYFYVTFMYYIYSSNGFLTRNFFLCLFSILSLLLMHHYSTLSINYITIIIIHN